MKRQRNTTNEGTNWKHRNTEIQISEEDIGKLPEKESRIKIVKWSKTFKTKLRKCKNQFKRDLEELKNKHTETNNTPTEIKIL